MGYCKAADIKSSIRELDTESNNLVLSEDKITNFINEESAAIDSKIGHRYQIPLDEKKSPQSFLALSRICHEMVLARIAPIIFPNDEEGGGLGRAFDTEKALNDFVEEKSALVDAVPRISASGSSLTSVMGSFPEQPFTDTSQF